MSAGAHHDNWLDELTSTKGLSIGWDFTLLAVTRWLLIWLPMAVVSRFDETHLFVISDVGICLIFAIDGYLVNKLHPDHRLDRGIVLRVVASFPVFALSAATWIG